MNAVEVRPSVRVGLSRGSTIRGWWSFSCAGCSATSYRFRRTVHDAAREHAVGCVQLAERRLRWDIRRHAEFLRVRAIVLSVAVESQTRITLPWVELRRVADELDELTGLVRTSQRITGDAIPVEEFQAMWHPYVPRAVAS